MNEIYVVIVDVTEPTTEPSVRKVTTTKVIHAYTTVQPALDYTAERNANDPRRYTYWVQPVLLD